jgi:hypothetical protein
MEPKGTWTVQDATKIQAFMRCPRAYFYEYVLGWRQDRQNIDITFGSAWHKAMEVILAEGYSTISLAVAFEAFQKVYQEGVSPDLEWVTTKTPGNALRALEAYSRNYANDFENYEVLKTEVAGSVFLGIDNLHFKIDAIVRDKNTGLIYALEHKTTSNFSPQWVNQWRQKMQIGVYLYVLHALYKEAGIGGLIVNGVAIRNPPTLKKDGNLRAGARDTEFMRIKCNWSMARLEEWLETTSFYYEWILQEFSNLSRCERSDNCLHAFPKNIEACTLYYGCPFLDFCSAVRNPLRIDYVPIGFKEEHWDPRLREANAKEVINIDFKEVESDKIPTIEDSFELLGEAENNAPSYQGP